MAPEEIATYNYIYANESPEEAIKFYEYIKSDLYRRQREAEEEMWAKRAGKDPAGTSVFSILMSPMKGVSYAMQLGDYLGDGKIDQNAPYNSFSYVPAAIRSEVAKNTEKYWVDRGHKFVGKSASFLYQTGMSMGDFVFNTAVSGGNSKVALAIMGTGAAADATIEAKDRGLSDDQAFALGTIAGIAEVVTEKFSLDALLKGKWEEGAIRYLIKNAFTEGAEEVGSDAINLFADILISKDQSKWAQAITAYEDEGKSESEAFWRAVQDQALSMGLDFLGGALSGGVLSGVNVAIDSHYDRAVGRDFRQGLKSMDGVYQAVIDTGLESDADSNAYRLAKRYQQQLDKKGALTDGQLGRLYRANIAAIEAEGMKAGTAIRADTSVFDGRILQDLNKARAAFIEFAKKHFPSTVKNIETGREIGISRKGLDKFLSGRIAYEKYASGFHIPELVERAHKVAYAKNEHVEQAESIPTYDYYDSPIEIDGINYMAHIRVRNTMMGDKYYGHTISEIEDIKIEPSARTSVPGKTPAGQPVNAIDGSINSIPQTTQDVNLRRSLPGDIPADIPPGLRKLYRLAQEMSASPPPREIPQRPVQQSPQEILSQLAREMTMDPQAREIPQRPVQQSPQEILTQLAKEMAQDPSSPLADLSDEDLADILSSIAPEGKGASQDIEGTSPGTSVEIRTVDFANKASVMEQLTLAQKETAELDHEVCYSVTADGKVWKVSGEAGAVNPSAIPSSLAGSYSFHNHPRAKTWFSFSPADVRFFFQSGEQFAKAADYLYEYTMERTEDTVDIDPDVVYHRFKEIEDTEVAQLKWDRLIDPDLDGYHETMKRLSKELKFYYERKERQ